MPGNGPAPSGPKPPASPAPPPARGRNIDLRSNSVVPQGEGPRYPTVAGVTWNFDGKRSSYLLLEDERAEPRPERPGDAIMGFSWGLLIVAVLIALVILTSRG